MAPKKNNNALIIFIKNPVKGRVKTRLAKDADEDYALKVYLELQNYTRDVSLKTDATRYLYYSSHIQGVDLWDPLLFNKRLQSNGDLGERMRNAFAEILTFHEKVIIIGSDCIQLDSEILNSAFVLLDEYDIVLGPAIDGGYYLLGVKEYPPDIFTSMPWSTGMVLDKTIERILKAGKSCRLLQELSDIDYLEDWERYGYEL